MDFNFTDEQILLRDSIHKFINKECPRDFVREFDETDEYPFEPLKKLSDLGYMMNGVPEEYGGTGGNIIDSMIVYEEISKVWPTLAGALGNVCFHGIEVILKNGSEEQKKIHMPKLIKGDEIFSFAISEPDTGSDAASLSTKAVLKNGYFLVNGTKMYVTGGGACDVCVVATRTAKSKYQGITLFLVDTKSEGFSAIPLKKLGLHGSSTCEVVLDDVKVSPENILGGASGLNRGWAQMMKLLNIERLTMACMALGIGEAALDDALQYANTRIQFDRPIGKFQIIQHKLVEMATELEAAKWLLYYAAWKESENMECVKETSMAKFFVAETVKNVVSRGMQILGGYGYMMEVDMQRYLRDAFLFTIVGGTTEIQKNIIGKSLGL